MLERSGASLTDLFACPRCRGPLSNAAGALVCQACPATYPVIDGIPVFAEESAIQHDELDLHLREVFDGEGLAAPLLGDAALDAVPAEARYSYVFDGRASLLDHAFASSALLPLLAAADIWHINADEPYSRDYSLRNPSSQYGADAWRCSDHDPIWIDLRL